MSKVDEKIPVTTSIGILIQSQDVHPVIIHKSDPSPHVHNIIKRSSTNILIPPEARQPSEVPVLGEDPNIAGAIAGLIAPHHIGETTQHYEQWCAASERLCGTPMPAFFGQAGEQSEKLMERSAPLAVEISKKTAVYYHKKTATTTTSSSARIVLHCLTMEPKTKQAMYVCITDL